jgi:hypothetical protein
MQAPAEDSTAYTGGSTNDMNMGKVVLKLGYV